VDEAKEVYPKLGILANVGLIAAGSFTRYVTERLAKGNEIMSLQVGRVLRDVADHRWLAWPAC
jgi:hypothetical protein